MLTLREFRQAEKLTLQALAARLGVHFTTVQKWEAGERFPDARAIVRIEDMTGGRVRAASFVAARDARASARVARPAGPLDCAAAA